MTRPSLTPHADQVREFEVPPDFREAARKPGREGATARVYIEMMEAYVRVLAAELDAGTDRGDIALAFSSGISGIIASLATHSTDKVGLGVLLLQNISGQVGRFIAGLEAGTISGTTLNVEEQHRA